ncbi:MAG TPA: fatty acid desaturase [Alloacidobacterium sp.]|nr:fatty acid desaturase [Alloacidobacterium sp.]
MPVLTEEPSATHTATAATPRVTSDADLFLQEPSGKFNWVFGIWIAIFHIGAIAAFFFFSWSALIVTAVLWLLGQNVGIAMSYHRQLTHRGFTTPKWVEYFMAICGTLSLQGGPLYWVAVHRLHHQHTDKPGDPHSPHDGGWWSHVGWILYGSVHNTDQELLTRYAPDLAKQRFYLLLSKYHWVPITVVGIVLAIFGGVSWVLWGVFFRVALGLHVTWLVNSATHMWGSKRFATRDDSRNLWWVALLSGGEGWHNNHHAHPVSASHGMAWYEFDFNYWCIRVLGAMGLAKKIKVQGPEGGTARILHG